MSRTEVSGHFLLQPFMKVNLRARLNIKDVTIIQQDLGVLSSNLKQVQLVIQEKWALGNARSWCGWEQGGGHLPSVF